MPTLLPRRLHRALLAIGIAATGVAAAGSPDVEFIQPEAAKAANLPFSQAVRVGDLLLLSGQIGFDGASGRLVEGGLEAETRRTMDNIKGVLESRGLDMSALVKCTVMLADMADWPAFNTIYRSYFPDGRYPARSAFGANGLALGARVEVECIAAANAADGR